MANIDPLRALVLGGLLTVSTPLCHSASERGCGREFMMDRASEIDSIGPYNLGSYQRATDRFYSPRGRGLMNLFGIAGLTIVWLAGIEYARRRLQ